MEFGTQRIRRISVTDEVVKRIKDQICSGRLAVGEKLPTEGELQKSLGVGRSTVREALRVLQTMGLVAIESGRGAFVKSTAEPDSSSIEGWMVENEERLEELFDVRKVVESLAVELAVEKASPEEMAKLVEINKAFGKACDDRNATLLAKLDEEFHAAIYAASKNDFLFRLGRMFNASLRPFRARSFAHERFAFRAKKPHADITAAMLAKDEKKAAKVMRDHLDVTLKVLRDARETHESKRAIFEPKS